MAEYDRKRRKGETASGALKEGKRKGGMKTKKARTSKRTTHSTKEKEREGRMAQDRSQNHGEYKSAIEKGESQRRGTVLLEEG